jgi:nitroreductase
MNPELSLFFGRRSIRKYAPGEISDSLVRDLLEAGMAAPSAVEKDPWHLIVLRQREVLARVAEGLPNGRFLAEAGLGIVVAGDLEQAHGRELSYLLQDCSACTQNILLAAHALGLGACWLGVHPREPRVVHLRAVLGIPAHVLPVAAIAVGWPAKSEPARTRYDEAKVHRDRW